MKTRQTKPTRERKFTLGVYLTIQTQEKVESAARRSHMTKSEWCRNVIELALRDGGITNRGEFEGKP